MENKNFLIFFLLACLFPFVPNFGSYFFFNLMKNNSILHTFTRDTTVQMQFVRIPHEMLFIYLPCAVHVHAGRKMFTVLRGLTSSYFAFCVSARSKKLQQNAIIKCNNKIKIPNSIHFSLARSFAPLSVYSLSVTWCQFNFAHRFRSGYTVFAILNNRLYSRVFLCVVGIFFFRYLSIHFSVGFIAQEF